MKIMKKSLFAAGLFLASLSCFGTVKFGDADINQDDEILYTIKHDIPGTYSYRSLFKGKIKNGQLEGEPALLTCFPEQMELLSGGTILQIRNRYGIAWLNTISKSITWKKYSGKIPLNSMRLSSMSVSPNGDWLCYTEKTGYASGKLFLENVNSGKRFLLDEHSAFNYDSVPVKWIADSSVMVYAKNGEIYFCNPAAVARGVEVSEEFRRIGPGTINSVNWVNGRYLLYIDSDLVYKISAKELYTLGLYSGIIGKGQTVGRLPCQFQSNKDTFSVSNDVSGMVLIQNRKIFTYFSINRNTSDYLDIVYSGPYVDFKASLFESEVIWDENNNPSLWLRCLPFNGEKLISSVYHLENKLTKFLEIENSGSPVISKDGRNCAFYSGTTVHVYDVKTWKKIAKLEGENIVSLVWENNSTLIIGGDKTIRRWNILEEKADPLLITSAANGWWNEDTGSITADVGSGTVYTYDSVSRIWNFSGQTGIHSNVLRNGRYRVFCGETPNKNFENALYIRTLAGKAVTKAAYPESAAKTEDRRKVSLLFDAYDNADGLTSVLYILNKYKVKGTFFLNGEFIRRYPNETKQIAYSGNECASMFFSIARLTQPGFVLNEDYIRRGLARTEDEFNGATGKELSLMWHAPYYQVTDKIIEAGRTAGYAYAATKQTADDTVTLEMAVNGEGKYYSPCGLIDSYMKMLESNAGGAIPVTVGISRGSRESYLYDHLDLLLSAILDAGYEVVPLRYIVEN